MSYSMQEALSLQLMVHGALWIRNETVGIQGMATNKHVLRDVAYELHPTGTLHYEL